MISSVHILGDHSAHLKNPEYNAAQLPLTCQVRLLPVRSVSFMKMTLVLFNMKNVTFVTEYGQNATRGVQI